MSELQVAPQQFAHVTSARIVHGDLIDTHDQIYEIPHSRKAAANVRQRAARLEECEARSGLAVRLGSPGRR
ncbi:MAG: hypothetical protein ACLP5E_00075 [Streptosporangiaceae bacterium]|jgi:hypothetical protein